MVATKVAVEDTMVLGGGGNVVEVAVEDAVVVSGGGGGGGGGVEDVVNDAVELGGGDKDAEVAVEAAVLDVDLCSSSLSSPSSFCSAFLSSPRRRKRRRPARLSRSIISSRLRYLGLVPRLLTDILVSSIWKSWVSCTASPGEALLKVQMNSRSWPRLRV